MTQTLRMKIPPANPNRPSNGATQKSARFVLEAAPPAAHGTKSPQRTHQSTSKLKTPLMPVRGFCFFADAMPSSADQYSMAPPATVTRNSPRRDLAHIVNAALA